MNAFIGLLFVTCEDIACQPKSPSNLANFDELIPCHKIWLVEDENKIRVFTFSAWDYCSFVHQNMTAFSSFCSWLHSSICSWNTSTAETSSITRSRLIWMQKAGFMDLHSSLKHLACCDRHVVVLSFVTVMQVWIAWVPPHCTQSIEAFYWHHCS